MEVAEDCTPRTTGEEFEENSALITEPIIPPLITVESEDSDESLPPPPSCMHFPKREDEDHADEDDQNSLDSATIASVLDVLPDTPLEVMREMMHLFPVKDIANRAELLIRHILENGDLPVVIKSTKPPKKKRTRGRYSSNSGSSAFPSYLDHVPSLNCQNFSSHTMVQDEDEETLHNVNLEKNVGVKKSHQKLNDYYKQMVFQPDLNQNHDSNIIVNERPELNGVNLILNSTIRNNGETNLEGNVPSASATRPSDSDSNTRVTSTTTSTTDGIFSSSCSIPSSVRNSDIINSPTSLAQMSTCTTSSSFKTPTPSFREELDKRLNSSKANASAFVESIPTKITKPVQDQAAQEKKTVPVTTAVTTSIPLTNQRFYEEKSAAIVNSVLSVLPGTPIETIQELIQSFPNGDAGACADNICNYLLENMDILNIPNDDALDDPFPDPGFWTMEKPSTMSSNINNDDEPQPGTSGTQNTSANQNLPGVSRLAQKRKHSSEDEAHQPGTSGSNPQVSNAPEDSLENVYECNCCYNEVKFEDMVQCADGHLFCAECLRRYTEEAVYGQGQKKLVCMQDGCDENFPASQLMRAVPEQLRLQYEERIAEEVLNMANLENLIRCPFCNYQALLDEEQHIFVCPNQVCQKRSCRKCGVVWEDHEGLLCNQIERETETKIRTDYEEKMANARIRTCSSCKAKFTKEDGCNRITCRCGKQLCYICRQLIKGYDHFCQHPRIPKQPCKKCQNCFLWTDAEYDDRLAISEIKKEATQFRAAQGFEDDKEIGAPASPERPKTEPNAAVPIGYLAGVIANRLDMNRPRYRIAHNHMGDVIAAVAAGNLPREENIAAGAAPAVAHPRNMLLRDVHPRNVFLERRVIPLPAAANPVVHEPPHQEGEHNLDLWQRLLRDMQQQVRNLTGNEPNRVRDAQTRLQLIAQEANVLAQRPVPRRAQRPARHRADIRRIVNLADFPNVQHQALQWAQPPDRQLEQNLEQQFAPRYLPQRPDRQQAQRPNVYAPHRHQQELNILRRYNLLPRDVIGIANPIMGLNIYPPVLPGDINQEHDEGVQRINPERPEQQNEHNFYTNFRLRPITINEPDKNQDNVQRENISVPNLLERRRKSVHRVQFEDATPIPLEARDRPEPANQDPRLQGPRRGATLLGRDELDFLRAGPFANRVERLQTIAIARRAARKKRKTAEHASYRELWDVAKVKQEVPNDTAAADHHDHQPIPDNSIPKGEGSKAHLHIKQSSSQSSKTPIAAKGSHPHENNPSTSQQGTHKPQNDLHVENFAEAFWGPEAIGIPAFEAFNNPERLPNLARVLDRVGSTVARAQGRQRADLPHAIAIPDEPALPPLLGNRQDTPEFPPVQQLPSEAPNRPDLLVIDTEVPEEPQSNPSQTPELD